MVVEVKPQRAEDYSESEVRTLLGRYAHAKAIKDMWVRGAPLIGVTAAFGFAKSMQHDNSDKFLEEIKQDYIV